MARGHRTRLRRLGTALPSIVDILADDLGYGDVQALNPAGRIATPHIDDLAAQGMAFTDAHASASVCTPSRSIRPLRLAHPPARRRARRRGAAPDRSGAPHRPRAPEAARLRHRLCREVDLGMDGCAAGASVRGRGRPHPDARHRLHAAHRERANRRGFDYFFGIAGSLNMPPFTFIENDRVLALPIVEKGGDRSAPDFEAVDVLPRRRSARRARPAFAS